MEVTVLEAANLPNRPVMAIHAGSVRRQAKLEVNSPFVIPHPGAQCGSVEVSVFQQIASQVLLCDNPSESVCSIPVSSRDGTSSLVQLRVRRGDAALSAISADKVKPGSAEDSIGMTRDYLDHHQLQQCIQKLIQDVLRVQPDNPYKYMLEQLRKENGSNATALYKGLATAQSKTDAVADSQEPLVPRPPEKPKPDGPRGRSIPSSSAPSAPSAAPQQHPKQSLLLPGSMPRPSVHSSAAARFSVVQILNSQACRKAAEYSLRAEVRKEVAGNLGLLALNSVKEKFASQASRQDPRSRGSIVTLPNPSHLDAAVFHRTLVKWAAHLAFRGACKILGYSRRVSKTTLETADAGRRSSMPSPIVFLDSDTGGEWGTWLR
jgi:hypothetical protein